MTPVVMKCRAAMPRQCFVTRVLQCAGVQRDCRVPPSSHQAKLAQHISAGIAVGASALICLAFCSWAFAWRARPIAHRRVRRVGDEEWRNCDVDTQTVRLCRCTISQYAVCVFALQASGIGELLTRSVMLCYLVQELSFFATSGA